jgi:hypothetical protein
VKAGHYLDTWQIVTSWELLDSEIREAGGLENSEWTRKSKIVYNLVVMYNHESVEEDKYDPEN